MARVTVVPETIDYPDSDGLPMAENESQFWPILYVGSALDRYYQVMLRSLEKLALRPCPHNVIPAKGFPCPEFIEGCRRGLPSTPTGRASRICRSD